MAKFKIGDKVRFSKTGSVVYTVVAVSRVSMGYLSPSIIIYRIEDNRVRDLWPWYPEDKLMLVPQPKKLYRIYKDIEAANEVEARGNFIDGWNVEAR